MRQWAEVRPAAGMTRNHGLHLSLPRVSEAVHVRLWKIVPFGKEWLTGSFCQSISKAISEIEAGGMPAFAESAPSGARDFNLSRIHGYDLNSEAVKKKIEFAACHFTAARFQYNG